MYLIAPFPQGFSPNNTSKIVEFSLMHCLLAAQVDPGVLTNIRKLRLSKLTVQKHIPEHS